MSAGHTPGPWKYGHLGTDVLWIGPDYNQPPVAHVDHDMEYARDNSLANARLIAAVPELLAAGLMLLEACDKGDADMGMDGYDALRAALAKAEGRS